MFVFSGISFDPEAPIEYRKYSFPDLLALRPDGALQSGGREKASQPYNDDVDIGEITRGGDGRITIRGRWVGQLKLNVRDGRVTCYSHDVPKDSATRHSSYHWSVATAPIEGGQPFAEGLDPGVLAVHVQMDEDSIRNSTKNPGLELHVSFTTDNDELFKGYAGTGLSSGKPTLRWRVSPDYQTVVFSAVVVIGADDYGARDDMRANTVTLQGRITCADVPRKIRGFAHPSTNG